MILNTSELSASYLSRATAIFVVDCCQFGPIWIFGLKMELLACADLVGVTNGAKLSFSWPYMIVSMIWKNSELSALYLIRATAIFVVGCCQFGPSWMFILSMIWNTSELSTSHLILPWSVFTHTKKGCLSYNLQYTKYIRCTRNIWMIFEYHDDNYEWIFMHQIYLELVPQRIFTFWILLCWTLVAIRAINMHTDLSKYNNI